MTLRPVRPSRAKYVSGGMDFAKFGTVGSKVYRERPDFRGLSLGKDLAMAAVNLSLPMSKLVSRTRGHMPMTILLKGLPRALADLYLNLFWLRCSLWPA